MKRMSPMMASQSRPLIANPTTARIAQTTKRITITVNMVVTVPAYGRGSDGCGLEHERRHKAHL